MRHRIEVVERAAKLWRARGYHRYHRAQAEAAYREILEREPSAALSAKTERDILDYSRSILGSRKFAPWLRVYTAYRGEFVEGWIPDNYLGGVVLPEIQNISQKRVSSAKTLTRRLLRTERLPDLAYRLRGFWLDRECRPLASDQIVPTLFAGGDTAFVKQDQTNRGEGITEIHRAGFDLSSLDHLGDIAVQAAVDPCEAIASIMPDNCAAVRVITIKPTGKPAIACSTCCVFGRSGRDNTRAGTSLLAVIDQDTGKMLETGHLSPWAKTDRHPDTGAVFGGVEIPSIAEANRLCSDLHDTVPQLSLIGWDLGIDRNNRVHILEWNTGHIGIDPAQVFSGAILAPLDLERLAPRTRQGIP